MQASQFQSFATPLLGLTLPSSPETFAAFADKADALEASEAPDAAIEAGDDVKLNLLEYLESRPGNGGNLANRIIEVALSQTSTPYHLRDDAAQEIRIMWMGKYPDVARFEEGQIASYAHCMAKHAALRCRRELGNAVRLPGSAFRKRRDGTTYVQPGTIARPLDWDELDEWLPLADQPDAGAVGMEARSYTDEEFEVVQREEEAVESLENERRTEVFLAITEQLSDKGRAVLELLLAGHSLGRIQEELDVTPVAITREATKIRALLEARGLVLNQSPQPAQED